MPYVYEPLDTSTKQIRLITILPGSGCSAIRCELQSVDLAMNPRYEALSYEWGSVETTCAILLWEETFPVRTNLWLALSHLRSTKVSQTFWIDAICIDQSNISERNVQVQMMGDIYRQASLVRAWLGKGSDANAEAFQLLRRFKKAQSGGRESKMAHKLTSREHVVLNELTHRTYWSRVWIGQELVLAQTIVLHCGEQDIVWWPLLLRSLRLAGYLHSPAGLVLSLRDRRRRNSLLVLMGTCHSAQATDVRDKVYALLAIADDVKRDAIMVDYAISVEDLKNQVDRMYRSQELEATPLLWVSLGSSTTADDVCDPELGFSRYIGAYFRNPDVFGRMEDARVLAVSTSYSTAAVKDKFRQLVIDLETSENFNSKRVDSGIAMED